MAERKQLAIVVHACSPSILGAEAGGLPWFPGQPGLYKKSLSQEVEGWGGDGWEGRREEERRKEVDLSLLWSQFCRRERAQASESCQPGSELRLCCALPVWCPLCHPQPPRLWRGLNTQLIPLWQDPVRLAMDVTPWQTFISCLVLFSSETVLVFLSCAWQCSP